MAKDSWRQKLAKRLSRTTYDSYLYENDFATGLSQNENPYNDAKDLLAIFENEPIAYGIVTTQADSIFNDYNFEFTEEKPKPAEKKVKDELQQLIRNPRLRFNQKLRSIAVKMLIDELCYLEVDPEAENFYVLNKQDCTIKFSQDNKTITGIDWVKRAGTETGQDVFIPAEKLVIMSYHDLDTNLWQFSAMRSLIDSANILYHARNYNNDIFRSGGVPSFAYIFKSGITKDVFKKTVREANTVKAGKNLFFKSDVDIKQIGGFNKDMEYEKLIKTAIQDFMTAMRVSPLMMNLWDKMGGEDKNEFNSFSEKIHTFQSILNDGINEVFWKIFITKTDDRVTALIAKALADKRTNIDTKLKKTKLLKARRRSNPYKKVVFKIRKWVDLRLLSAIQKIWLDTGVLSPNEARSQIGLEPRKDGDIYADISTGAGQMGNTGIAPNTVGTGTTDKPKASETTPKVSAGQKVDGVDK